jgi:TolB protein
MGRDGSGEHDLTQDPAADVEPSWAPDGTRVAFSSDRGGYDALYAVGRDGGPAALLSPSGLDGANPDWRR